MWWEGDAKEHKCLRMGPIPNHVSMAYEIKQDMPFIEEREKVKAQMVQTISKLAFKIWNTCPTMKHVALAKDIEELARQYFRIDEKALHHPECDKDTCHPDCEVAKAGEKELPEIKGEYGQL